MPPLLLTWDGFHWVVGTIYATNAMVAFAASMAIAWAIFYSQRRHKDREAGLRPGNRSSGPDSRSPSSLPRQRGLIVAGAARSGLGWLFEGLYVSHQDALDPAKVQAEYAVAARRSIAADHRLRELRWGRAP